MAPGHGEDRGEEPQALTDLLGLLVDAVAIVDIDIDLDAGPSTGPGARVRSANRHFATLAGVDPADLPGRRVTEVLPVPGLAGLVEAAWARRDAPGASVARFGERLLRVTATRLDCTPADGDPGVVLVVADVTDLLGEAAAAVAAKQRLDHLLDSLSATLWELEVRTGAVRYVTSPSGQRRGVPDDRVLATGGSLFSLVHPADIPRLTAAIRGLKPGEMTEVEHRLRYADGTDVPVRSHLRRSNDAQRTITGVTVDVQELQAERLRRHAAVGSLAGGVAHELNNALSAVYGHLAMLGRVVHDPRGQRSIAAAEGAAARAADITTRLLAFAGRQALDVSSVDVNALVREVAPDGPWQDGAVRIEHDLDPKVARCRIDHDRAASALGELLVNALEAMPDGGVVRLSTANLADAGGHELVEIAVSDTGCGMEPDVLARAIEPFFSTKPFGESTGLGLSTVYGFATQSDGSFLLESEAGRGTVARLRFPADRSDAAEETITLHATGSSGRVLLVDEDDMVRETTAQILTMLGLSVVAAGSADAAADAAAADRFDVLVVDVSLGSRLDGVGLVERLRERGPGPGVVVTSGFAMDQLDLSRLGGTYEFLPKPFTVAEVTGALRRAGWSGDAPLRP